MTQVNLTIRLSRKEKATLQRLALIENLTMTDFIKHRVFDDNNHNSNLNMDRHYPNNTTDKTDQSYITELLEQNHQLQKQLREQLNQNQELLSYLKLISQVTLSNNGMITKTIARELTLEEKEDIKKNAQRIIKDKIETKD